jgi:Kef-type K+ transport system membrane component KefB
MTPAELSMAFFLQLAVIIVACRVFGWLGQRFLDQPPVIGEMIAGVVLGPSLLGYFAPAFQAALFPAETKPVLYVIAQLGIGLFMFVVGLGFRKDQFRMNLGSAGMVSLSGMAVPFLAAVLITPWLMGFPGLFDPRVTLFQATLFTGACIAITAFPVLARFLHDRGLADTPLGTLTLSAGAINDAAAWAVLAIVLASFGAGAAVAVKAIVGGFGFVLVALTLGPRLLAPLGRIVEREGRVSHQVMAITLVLFGLCAFAMDFAGIHAVFGGFILGVVMPRGAFADKVRGLLEPFAVVALLPVFFTFSGLNTQFALVADVGLIGVAAAIIAVSIIAKGGACWAAARLSGQDNATALGIGALMNARGLMELLIINIGLQRGIIGPALFSILVLMTIVTTFMASPLFELVYGRRARAEGRIGAIDEPAGDAAESRTGH